MEQDGSVVRTARAMQMLTARSAGGARLRVVRAAWRSTTDGHVPAPHRLLPSNQNLLLSPALVTPALDVTSNTDNSYDSCNEEKYHVSEPDDSEISEKTNWKRATLSSISSQQDENQKESNGNDDLFRDIDNFILKPSHLRNSTLITEDSLNEIRGRIKSLVNDKPSQNSDGEANIKNTLTRNGSIVSNVINKMEQSTNLIKTNGGNNSLNSKISKTSPNRSSDEWFNRRKSYGFERMYTNRDSLNINGDWSKDGLESSTDSGICRSTEMVENNKVNIQSLPNTLRAHLNNISESCNNTDKSPSFQEWLQVERHNKMMDTDNNLLRTDSFIKSDGKISSFIPKNDNGINLKSSGKISITIPVTDKLSPLKKEILNKNLYQGSTINIESYSPHFIVTNSKNICNMDRSYLDISKRHSIATENGIDFNNQSNFIISSETKKGYGEHTDKKSKRVEFCKTEVHFAAEPGRVNIIESDEKPPPTNNFRRRRRNSSAFSYLHDKSDVYKPVTLFGEHNSMNSQEFVEHRERSDFETDLPGLDNIKLLSEEYSEPRGILKNKPIKPRPYHLGENNELLFENSETKSEDIWGIKLKPIVNQTSPNYENPSTVILLNKSLNKEQSNSQAVLSKEIINDAYENTNKLNYNHTDYVKEPLCNFGGELSVHKHLQKLKETEKDKYNKIEDYDQIVSTHSQRNHIAASTCHASSKLEKASNNVCNKISLISPTSPTNVKARKLKDHEFVYFGVNSSIKNDTNYLTKKYSVENSTTHVESKNNIARSNSMVKEFRKKFEADSTEVQEQPIYQNLVLGNNIHKTVPIPVPRKTINYSKYGEQMIAELNKAANDIMLIANQYSDNESSRTSGDDEKNIKSVQKSTKILEPIKEAVVNCTSVKKTIEDNKKNEKSLNKVSSKSSSQKSSKSSRSRRLHRLSSRESLLNSLGSSSEDVSPAPVLRRRKLKTSDQTSNKLHVNNQSDTMQIDKSATVTRHIRHRSSSIELPKDNNIRVGNKPLESKKYKDNKTSNTILPPDVCKIKFGTTNTMKSRNHNIENQDNIIDKKENHSRKEEDNEKELKDCSREHNSETRSRRHSSTSPTVDLRGSESKNIRIKNTIGKKSTDKDICKPERIKKRLDSSPKTHASHLVNDVVIPDQSKSTNLGSKNTNLGKDSKNKTAHNVTSVRPSKDKPKPLEKVKLSKITTLEVKNPFVREINTINTPGDKGRSRKSKKEDSSALKHIKCQIL